MVRWRSAGESMGTVDLGEIKGDQIVIHYGGALTSVNAYTFANSLIAFADTVQAINKAIDPKQVIEIRVESLDTGSFRAILKRVPKEWGNIFAKKTEEFFWTLICSFIIDRVILNDPKTTINISSDQVVIQKGSDRYIIPRAIYDTTSKLRNDPAIQENISKTFEVVSQDPAIDNFGLTPNQKDKEPLIQFRRDEFDNLSLPIHSLLPDEPNFKRRERKERATLLILKAWLRRGPTKWTFEWNGFPISAPIKDAEFFTRLENREFLIGAGDALDVELSYIQELNEAGVYANNMTTFVVEKVYGPVPRGSQLEFKN